MNQDGSLTFDTELDSKGFEKGSDKLFKAVEDLADALDIVGDKMMSSFQEITPILKSIGESTAGIYAAISGNAAKVVSANDEVSESAERAEASVQGMGSAAQGAMRSAASSTSRITGNVSKETAQLEKQVQGLEVSLANGFKNPGQVMKFNNSLNSAKETLTQLKARVEELGNAKIETAEYAKVTKEIEKTEAQLIKLLNKQEAMQDSVVDGGKYQNLRHEIKLTEAEITKLRQNGGSSYQDLGIAEMKLVELLQEQKKYDEELKKLENSKAYRALATEIEQCDRKLTDLEKTQERLSSSGGDFTTGFEADASLSESAEKLDNIGAALSRLDDAKPMSKAGTYLSSAQSLLGGINNAINRVGAVIAKVMKTAAKWFGKGFQAAKRFAGAIGKIAFAPIVAGVKKLGSSMKTFISNTKKSSFSIDTLVRKLISFKTLLKSRIRETFITALFHDLRTAVQALALYSSQFDASMSSMMNRTKETAGNIAVSFGNLVNAVSPAISTLIDMLSKAFIYLNSFIALLQGKSTVTVAKKQTGAYSDRLKEAAGNAKEAAKEQEELNRQVYGFDELNKRSKESDTAKDSGAENPLAGMDLYEEVPIDSMLPKGLKDWFERIKDAFKKGDWYGLGQIIADGLNHAMKVVDDWINNVFRPLGVLWAGRIAEILNGLVDGLNWRLMGKTIADGMNAIADIINTFLTKFNFENLGKGLGKALKGWFDNIEWDLMGKTVANGFNAIIDTFYGFMVELEGYGDNIGIYLAEFWNNFMDTIHLNNLALALQDVVNEFFAVLGGFADANKWGKHGSAVASAVKTFFDGIAWAENGKNLTNFLNGILESVYQFFFDMKDAWRGIGAGIAAFVGQILTGFDFAKLGTTIAMGFNAIVDLILGYAQNFPWREAGENLGEGINNLFTNINWENAGQAANELLTGLVEFLKGVVAKVDWKEVGTNIGTFLDQIDWGDILGGVFEIIWEVLSGLIAGLFDSKTGKVIIAVGAGILAIKGTVGGLQLAGSLGQWYTDSKPVLDGLGGLFGAAGKSAVKGGKSVLQGAKTIGAKALPAISAGAKTLGAKAVPAVTTAAKGISGAIAKAGAAASGLAPALGVAGASALAAVGGWEIGKGISHAVFDDAEEAFNNFSFSGLFDAMHDSLTGEVETSWTGFSEYLYENLNGSAQDIMDGFFGGISSFIDGVGGFATWVKESIFDPFINGIKSLFGIASPSTVMAEQGGYVIDGLLQGIMDGWEGITEFLSGAVSGLGELLSGAWEGIKTTASTVWNGVSSTVSGAWEGVKGGVSTGVEFVKDKASKGWETIKGAAGTAWNTVSSTVSGAWSGIKTSVSGAVETVKTKAIDGWENIKTKTSEKWESVKSTVAEKWEGLKEKVKPDMVSKKVSDGWESIKTTAGTKWENIKGTVSKAWSNIGTNGLKPNVVTSAASNAWNTVKSTATTKWSEIKNTVKEKWDGLKSVLKEKDWGSIGSNLVNGLKSGISNAWKSLKEKVAGLADGLTETLRNKFEVKSPSRVWARIGAYLDEGLMQGVEGGRADMLKAVSAMAADVTERMSNSEAHLSVSEDTAMNGLDAVAEKLSGIADIFTGISEALASMGGLKIPQVAEGTFVPYKVRVDGAMPSAVNQEAFSGIAGGMDERMSDQTYILRQLLDAVRALKLKVDADAIERSTTSTQRNRQLNFGGT